MNFIKLLLYPIFYVSWAFGYLAFVIYEGAKQGFTHEGAAVEEAIRSIYAQEADRLGVNIDGINSEDS